MMNFKKDDIARCPHNTLKTVPHFEPACSAGQSISRKRPRPQGYLLTFEAAVLVCLPYHLCNRMHSPSLKASYRSAQEKLPSNSPMSGE